MGPTGSGKTALALALARRFPLTAIVADLRQVMRGMETGSAQPTQGELAILPHKLSGILDPLQDITVNDWRRLALNAIAETLDDGRIPLVLGGSGMCVKALVSGERFDAPPAPILRHALIEWVELDGLKQVAELAAPLVKDLMRIDEFSNRQRVIRAIERYAFRSQESAPPLEIFPDYVQAAWITQCESWARTAAAGDEGVEGVPHSSNPQYSYKIFALLPDREWLRARIAARARAMFDGGLTGEVRALLDSGVSREARALRGHGYPEALAVLDGRMSVEDAIERTTLNTARYAKRQITWIRHQFADVTWIEVDANRPPETAGGAIEAWIGESDRTP
jgi:tRNA dimethylallyltransferase